MTFYPTTLLPPSPPYLTYDAMVAMMIERCIELQYSESIPEADKTQVFDLTMILLEFWEQEGFMRGL